MNVFVPCNTSVPKPCLENWPAPPVVMMFGIVSVELPITPPVVTPEMVGVPPGTLMAKAAPAVTTKVRLAFSVTEEIPGWSAKAEAALKVRSVTADPGTKPSERSLSITSVVAIPVPLFSEMAVMDLFMAPAGVVNRLKPPPAPPFNVTVGVPETGMISPRKMALLPREKRLGLVVTFRLPT